MKGFFAMTVRHQLCRRGCKSRSDTKGVSSRRAAAQWADRSLSPILALHRTVSAHPSLLRCRSEAGAQLSQSSSAPDSIGWAVCPRGGVAPCLKILRTGYVNKPTDDDHPCKWRQTWLSTTAALELSFDIPQCSWNWLLCRRDWLCFELFREPGSLMMLDGQIDLRRAGWTNSDSLRGCEETLLVSPLRKWSIRQARLFAGSFVWNNPHSLWFEVAVVETAALGFLRHSRHFRTKPVCFARKDGPRHVLEVRNHRPHVRHH